LNRHAAALLGIFLLANLPVQGTEIAQPSETKIVPDISKPRHQERRDGASSRRSFQALLKSRQQIYYQHGSVAQGQLAQLLYKTPSDYPCGYVYTAELTSAAGDADLYLHEKVSGTWRKLKESIKGSGVMDSFSFTCSDITPSATNVDLDAKGYSPGIATYDFFLYQEAAASSFTPLTFPLNGYTSTSAPVTAIVDLDTRWNYIQTRTGEVGDYWSGCLAYVGGITVACDPNNTANAAAPWAYKMPGGGSYNVSAFNYQDAAPGVNVYMWYDNHRGYDYAAPEGTSVFAAASGQVTGIDLSMGQVEITHSNGYKTYYLHMRNILVSVSMTVIPRGQKIGEVSHTGAGNANHLHFGIYDASGALLDPYGRTGLYPSMW